MKVLKFGGTSLGDALRMQNVAEIVTFGEPVLVVLSAVSGTTDSLVNIVELIKSNEFEKAKEVVHVLREHYQHYTNSLYRDELIKSDAVLYVESQLQDIMDNIVNPGSYATESNLLAKGELISTYLFYCYLKQQKIAASLLSSLDFLRLTKSSAPDEEFLESQLNAAITENPSTEVFIAQGFICRNAFGEISNLKRGGSDYSASLFAAAINSEEVQIWTDIDGMHNNDPRFIKNTKPIRELSFDEAAELAYFGAKILHPSSIKPARKKNIPVKLLNTLEPLAVGTVISSKSSNSRIKAVAAKSGITAIKIRSSEMLQAPGFLRRVFEVFELYHTSIDVITTSEVAVSLTIDDTQHLQPIVKTLQEFGHVDIDKGLSIICVVGDFVVESTGVAAQVIQSMNDIPIRMISYGGSDHNITLLISESEKVNALKALHKGLFDE